MSFVHFVISNSRDSLTTERPFPSTTTVGILKGKLELLTGIMMHEMKLEVYDERDTLCHTLEDDDQCISQLQLPGKPRLHVIDTTNKVINMEEELANVKKFEISDEEYAKRENSVRKFKEEMMAQGISEKKKHEEEREAAERQIASTMKVGDRCEVRVEGQSAKRGEVAYIGIVEFKPGQMWIGVKYDEPVGKNNGTVQGKSYFECRSKFGGFVRPSFVSVGDYPPLDDLDLDEF